jgi:hypothetical protein
MTTCPITQAESNYQAGRERRQTTLDRIAADLQTEYMAACMLPLLSTVSVPTDTQPGRRAPLLEVLVDALGETHNRHIAARVVSILTRTADGLDVLRELGAQHGAHYNDMVQQ